MAYDLASIVGTGYKTGAEIGQDITRGNALQVAMQQTPDTTDPDTGATTKDMFQVDTLAAQLTARAGNSRASDYFTKQAQDFKGAALDNQLKELKVREAHHDEFDRQLGTMGSGEELVKAALTSKDLTEPERMRLIALGHEAKTPDQWKALKTNLEQHSKSGREALEAQRKALKFEQGDWADKEQARHNRVSEANQANQQNRSEKHWQAEHKLKVQEAERKQEKDDQATILNYDDKLIKAGKIKDETLRNSTIKALKREKADAEQRMRNRGNSDDSGEPDSMGRYKGKEGSPTGGKQAAVAKTSAKEPEVQEATGALLDQVKSTLGKSYDPNKRYTVDSEGNIRLAKDSKQSEPVSTKQDTEDKPPVRKIVKDRPMEQQSLDRLWQREMAEYEKTQRWKRINAIVEEESGEDWTFLGTEGDDAVFRNSKTGKTKKRSFKE
jgi:hypothetical protein